MQRYDIYIDGVLKYSCYTEAQILRVLKNESHNFQIRTYELD